MPAAPPRSANRRLAAIIGAVVGLVVIGTLTGVLTGGGGDDVATSAVPTTALAAPAVVDPGTITASATSVLAHEGSLNYGVDNTLDNNAETAWNGASGAGVGETLTYRFDRPITLLTIRLINGYAWTPELYQANARIRTAVIVTDSGRFAVTVGDVADRQELTRNFGRTTFVALEVQSIYPGSTFEDLALTEIEFIARPAG